jgi:glutamate synthase domain-containing protein 1
MDTPIWPSSSLLTVTPSNSTILASVARQLYVGTGGDVTVLTVDNQVILFKNVGTAQVIGPFFVKRVNATGTTATDIVAFI